MTNMSQKVEISSNGSLLLKQFRRIATRYDKLDIRFEAFISIAAALIWLAWLSTQPRIHYLSHFNRHTSPRFSAGLAKQIGNIGIRIFQSDIERGLARHQGFRGISLVGQ